MSHNSLRFGPFTLDLQRLCLRGPSGEAELRPKTFEVLRYLVEHSGRVVSKEELIAAVWPDVVVTDDSLIRCIGEARRAIHDDGQTTIKTVQRRGYLFQAEVSTDTEAGKRFNQEAPRATLADAGHDLASFAGPSIVVLPFANLAGDPGEEYLSNGLTEDILTELSRFSELRVIGRHSSFHYKDKEIMPGQISRELGVGYILEGSVQCGRDRVRITAQLTDATTGAHLWAERYDRTLDDVFAVQDEVVRSIAPLLVAHVRKAEVERMLLKAPATWQAYHYFMRGLDLHLAYQSSQDVKALHEARRLLEQSIKIDPAYARPYSALAVSHLSSWANYGDVDFLQSTALERAQEFARHSVQIDSQLAYAQATFAHVLTWARQHEVALGALDRALRLNPSYSHWQVAAVQMFAGELDRAVESMQTYMRLDPFHPTSAIGWLGVTYCMLGRLTEALKLLREAVARSPKRAMFQYWLAAAYGHLGNVEAARNQARALLTLQPSFTITGTARSLAVFRSSALSDHFLDGLHKSGLPV